MPPNATLRYPKHLELEPDEFLNFIEQPTFTRTWQQLRLTDEDLLAVQVMICAEPTKAPVVSGTGRLRKLRFAREDAGKSSGFRILYAYFPAHGKVLLFGIYPKSRTVTISDAQAKQAKQILDEIKDDFSRPHLPQQLHPEA